MRFIAAGPDLPGNLLNARDEGDVVFVCGSGVSRRLAGLPDFFGLADAVIADLGVQKESDAAKVLRVARSLGRHCDIPGLVAADAVFGHLEREFDVATIQASVARALAPAPNVDVSAHATLLRLARTHDGCTKLITTNFDRLFERADSSVPIWTSLQLPSLSRFGNLDGIVYLHGRVNDDSSDVEKPGLILGSSDFGSAYLSDGWATEFLRKIVSTHLVVFIGYSADDPPMRYLLEGLHKTQGRTRSIYAFQSNDSEGAISRWNQRGVEAIVYDPAQCHKALWDTLHLWAKRAEDPAKWRDDVLKNARSGPRSMESFQRGQVAHIVSTHDGARAFSLSSAPATWLRVFDPSSRIGDRASRRRYKEGESDDPFVIYGLDSDPAPESTEPEARSEKPQIRWDAFSASITDLPSKTGERIPWFRGHYAKHHARLSKRLECLGSWLASVIDQPTTLWWAVQQEPLHPDIRRRMRYEVRRKVGLASVARQAWRYLLDHWDHEASDREEDWFELQQTIEDEGWTDATIRKCLEFLRPRVAVRLPIWRDEPTADSFEGSDLTDPLWLEVECPERPRDANIPNELLQSIVPRLRLLVEEASRLAMEVDDPERFLRTPLERDEKSDVSDHGRVRGLSGYVIWFAGLFDRLVQLDAAAAANEYRTWALDDNSIFQRLRLWAAVKREIETPEGFCRIVASLCEDDFWSSNNRRDLLVVMARRWNELDVDEKKILERRLLEGPPQRDHHTDEQHRKKNAWQTMNRLRWLADQGCSFTFDVDEEIASRRHDSLDWTPEWAQLAADSLESRAGFVATKTDSAPLDSVPLESLLDEAEKLSGRDNADFLVEHQPFVGWCRNHPQDALKVLSLDAEKGSFRAWAWKTLLWEQSQNPASPDLLASVATMISHVPDEQLAQFYSAATSWLGTEAVYSRLATEKPDVFDLLVDRLIEHARNTPSSTTSAIVDDDDSRDWTMDALNSPAGHLTQSLIYDPRNEDAAPDSHLALAFLDRLTRLLHLTGNARRHAIVICTHNLNWLFARFGEWTADNLLGVPNTDNAQDIAAFWAGVLWNPSISWELYRLLKVPMLAFAKEDRTARRGHSEALAYLALRGWLAPRLTQGPVEISDDELRDLLLTADSDLRSHVLWHVSRALNNEQSHDEERAAVAANLRDFFSTVWPRQKQIKTSATSLQLADMLLFNARTFEALSESVLPLLSRTTDARRIHLDDEVEGIAMSQPDHLIDLLYVILPDATEAWPNGTARILEIVEEHVKKGESKIKLSKLRRRMFGG